jgi:UPF0271 protein
MLDAVARAGGTRIVSVKAHGALYHRMSGDAECAAAVADAVTALDGPDMPALVLPAVDGAPTAAQAEVRAAVRARGLVAHFEAFCDRAYRADGSLLARSSPGAVITDPAEAGRRARALTLDGAVEAIDGTRLRLRPDTLCVHGDTAGAPAMARTVRTALEAAGVRVTAPTR